MRLLEYRTLPKYTQYEIASLVKAKMLESNKSLMDFAKEYTITEELLGEILSGKVIFKLKHYNAASRILNISAEKMLEEDQYVPDSVNFRANNNDPEIEHFVDKVSSIFTEWVYQKKVYGDIN